MQWLRQTADHECCLWTNIWIRHYFCMESFPIGKIIKSSGFHKYKFLHINVFLSYIRSSLIFSWVSEAMYTLEANFHFHIIWPLMGFKIINDPYYQDWQNLVILIHLCYLQIFPFDLPFSKSHYPSKIYFGILVHIIILDLKFPQHTSCVTVNMTLNYSGIGRHRERDPSKVIWLHWLKYPTNWAYNTNNLN